VQIDGGVDEAEPEEVFEKLSERLQRHSIKMDSII